MAGGSREPNFTMLSEHMHDTFVQYIEEGRTRAPPENLLGEMIPTFQFGAKTDRRALQSKFKSWSRRMEVKDGNLILSSTGKIILPKERCIELIMKMHSDNHVSVWNISEQVKKTYTWSRKNFGMDQEFVVDVIARNCPRKECMRSMLGASVYNNLLKGNPASWPQPLLPGFTGMRQVPSLINYPSLLPYQMPFPVSFSALVPPASFSCLPPFGNPAFQGNFNVPVLTREIPFNVEPPKIREFEKQNLLPAPVRKPSLSPLKQFTKSANFADYKTLVQAVKRNPGLYPKVLGTRKTQFLSEFGLVPKSICSMKTLRRFKKELKRKKAIARSVVQPKVLRDRNKLRMNAETRRARLAGINKSAKSRSRKAKRFRERMLAKTVKYLKLHEKKAKAGRSTKRESRRNKDGGEIEVINLASSSDESSAPGDDPPEEGPRPAASADCTQAQKRSDPALKATSTMKNISKQFENTGTSNARKFEKAEQQLLGSPTVRKQQDQADDSKVSNHSLSRETGGVTKTFQLEENQKERMHHESSSVGTGKVDCSANTSVTRSPEPPLNPSPPKIRVANLTVLKIPGTTAERVETPQQEDSRGNNKTYPKLDKVTTASKARYPTNVPKVFRLQPIIQLPQHQKPLILPKSAKLIGQAVSSAKELQFRPSNVQRAGENSNTKGAFPPIAPIQIGIRKLAPANDPGRQRALLANPVRVGHPVLFPVSGSKVNQGPRLFVVEKGPLNPVLIEPRYAEAHKSALAACTQDKPGAVPGRERRNDWRSKKISIDKLYDRLLETSVRKGARNKIDFAEEMKRISSCIRRMRVSVNSAMFQGKVEKTAKDITAHLDVGLNLVKEARKALMEIEREIDSQGKSISKPPMKGV